MLVWPAFLTRNGSVAARCFNNIAFWLTSATRVYPIQNAMDRLFLKPLKCFWHVPQINSNFQAESVGRLCSANATNFFAAPFRWLQPESFAASARSSQVWWDASTCSNQTSLLSRSAWHFLSQACCFGLESRYWYATLPQMKIVAPIARILPNDSTEINKWRAPFEIYSIKKAFCNFDFRPASDLVHLAAPIA